MGWEKKTSGRPSATTARRRAAIADASCGRVGPRSDRCPSSPALSLGSVMMKDTGTGRREQRPGRRGMPGNTGMRTHRCPTSVPGQVVAKAVVQMIGGVDRGLRRRLVKPTDAIPRLLRRLREFEEI